MTSRHRSQRGGKGGHEPSARIRARERRAMELTVVGWSQHQIAADLGVSQAAVSKILKRVDLRILQELAALAERHKVRQTLRLEHLYAEAMRAWEHSKSDTSRRRQRKTHGGSGGAGTSVAELVVETRCGDPRFLEEARKAMADHRKLWGLDAPQKLDVRTPSNPFTTMTEEQLRAELARQERLLTESMPTDIGSDDGTKSKEISS